MAVEPGSRRARGDWSEAEGPRALAVGRRDPRMCCAGRWSSRSLALPTGGRESCVWKRLASSRSPRYQPNVVGPRLVVEPVFVGTGGFLATAPRFYLERLHWGPTTHRGNIEGMYGENPGQSPEWLPTRIVLGTSGDARQGTGPRGTEPRGASSEGAEHEPSVEPARSAEHARHGTYCQKLVRKLVRKLFLKDCLEHYEHSPP